MELVDLKLKPYKWLNEAKIYNKKDELIPIEWLEENADVIVLLFTSNGTDKDGIIRKFYNIYENVKFVSVPIEVIYVPMDETEEEMSQSFEKQANWFTLKFSDPLVHVLQYMYGITSIPQLYVIRPDGTIVSRHGTLDLEEYGKNAVITWISKTATVTKHRIFSKELQMYGDKWLYINDPNKGMKPDYQRKFSNNLDEESPG